MPALRSQHLQLVSTHNLPVSTTLQATAQCPQGTPRHTILPESTLQATAHYLYWTSRHTTHLESEPSSGLRCPHPPIMSAHPSTSISWKLGLALDTEGAGGGTWAQESAPLGSQTDTEAERPCRALTVEGYLGVTQKND